MNLLHATIPAPRILRWLLNFWESCATLNYEILGVSGGVVYEAYLYV